MGLQIYGNIDAGSLLTGKVQSITNLSASGIKNLVAGDGLEVELFLTSQSGIVNIQDYSVRLSIGDLNARPTGGTWDLGSVTGIAYNVNASTLQANITSATSGNPANTTTELSPFVFKTVFTANGSQTIPTIDATSLTPNSTVSIVKLVEGDGSTQEQWLTRIFRNPIAFQDTWTNFTKTGVGNGISGILGLGTPEIYDQFSETITSFSSTMEMEITDTSGNTITIFQIPVTIGGEVTGAGITASPITPSSFTTTTDVNTIVDTVTAGDNSVFVSQGRGSDATGTRNSTTKPFLTFTAAVSASQTNDNIFILDGDFSSESTVTISGKILNIILEENTELGDILPQSKIRVKGLGNQSKIGKVTIGSSAAVYLTDLNVEQVISASGSGKPPLRIERCFISDGLTLSSQAVVSDLSTQGYFKDCIITDVNNESIHFDSAGGKYAFDNCYIGTPVRNGNVIKFTNGTSSNNPARLTFKDCVITSVFGYSAFAKTSTGSPPTINFVGGSTSISYFPNESDFTLTGNYLITTDVADYPIANPN